jgi:hypothetical protein
MFVCAGATWVRPDRPATIGRVEGLTCHSKLEPVVTISLVRLSAKVCAGPVSVQNTSRQRGDVDVWKLFESVSREPGGADPVSTLCSEGLAAAASAS